MLKFFHASVQIKVPEMLQNIIFLIISFYFLFFEDGKDVGKMKTLKEVSGEGCVLHQSRLFIETLPG